MSVFSQRFAANRVARGFQPTTLGVEGFDRSLSPTSVVPSATAEERQFNVNRDAGRVLERAAEQPGALTDQEIAQLSDVARGGQGELDTPWWSRALGVLDTPAELVRLGLADMFKDKSSKGAREASQAYEIGWRDYVSSILQNDHEIYERARNVSDTAAEQIGVAEKSDFSGHGFASYIDDAGWTTDENSAWWNKGAHMAAGFVGDVAVDPLSWVSFGTLGIGKKVATTVAVNVARQAGGELLQATTRAAVKKFAEEATESFAQSLGRGALRRADDLAEKMTKSKLDELTEQLGRQATEIDLDLSDLRKIRDDAARNASTEVVQDAANDIGELVANKKFKSLRDRAATDGDILEGFASYSATPLAALGGMNIIRPFGRKSLTASSKSTIGSKIAAATATDRGVKTVFARASSLLDDAAKATPGLRSAYSSAQRVLSHSKGAAKARQVKLDWANKLDAKNPAHLAAKNGDAWSISQAAYMRDELLARTRGRFAQLSIDTNALRAQAKDAKLGKEGIEGLSRSVLAILETGVDLADIQAARTSGKTITTKVVSGIDQLEALRAQLPDGADDMFEAVIATAASWQKTLREIWSEFRTQNLRLGLEDVGEIDGYVPHIITDDLKRLLDSMAAHNVLVDPDLAPNDQVREGLEFLSHMIGSRSGVSGNAAATVGETRFSGNRGVGLQVFTSDPTLPVFVKFESGYAGVNYMNSRLNAALTFLQDTPEWRGVLRTKPDEFQGFVTDISDLLQTYSTSVMDAMGHREFITSLARDGSLLLGERAVDVGATLVNIQSTLPRSAIQTLENLYDVLAGENVDIFAPQTTVKTRLGSIDIPTAVADAPRVKAALKRLDRQVEIAERATHAVKEQFEANVRTFEAQGIPTVLARQLAASTSAVDTNAAKAAIVETAAEQAKELQLAGENLVRRFGMLGSEEGHEAARVQLAAWRNEVATIIDQSVAARRAIDTQWRRKFGIETTSEVRSVSLDTAQQAALGGALRKAVDAYRKAQKEAGLFGAVDQVDLTTISNFTTGRDMGQVIAQRPRLDYWLEKAGIDPSTIVIVASDPQAAKPVHKVMYRSVTEVSVPQPTAARLTKELYAAVKKFDAFDHVNSLDDAHAFARDLAKARPDEFSPQVRAWLLANDTAPPELFIRNEIDDFYRKSLERFGEKALVSGDVALPKAADPNAYIAKLRRSIEKREGIELRKTEFTRAWDNVNKAMANAIDNATPARTKALRSVLEANRPILQKTLKGTPEWEKLEYLVEFYEALHRTRMPKGMVSRNRAWMEGVAWRPVKESYDNVQRTVEDVAAKIFAHAPRDEALEMMDFVTLFTSQLDDMYATLGMHRAADGTISFLSPDEASWFARRAGDEPALRASIDSVTKQMKDLVASSRPLAQALRKRAEEVGPSALPAARALEDFAEQGRSLVDFSPLGTAGRTHPLSGLDEVRSAEGFVTPASLGIQGGALDGAIMKQWAALALENMVNTSRAMYTPWGVASLQESARAFERYWKMFATVMRPTFVPRNLVGGVFNNMAIDVRAQDYALVGLQMTEFRRMIAPEMDYWSHEVFRKTIGRKSDFGQSVEKHFLNDRRLTPQQAIENLKARGGRSEKFARTLEQAISVNLLEAEFSDTILNFGQRGNPLLDNAITLTMRKLMESSEDFLRLAAFSRWVDEVGPMSAKEMVNAVHFDYSNLTAFETRIKGAIPFYVWFRRNVPLQLQLMLERPGITNRYRHLMHNADQELGGATPYDDWRDSQYRSPLAVRTDIVLDPDTPYWSRVIWDPDLPVGDLEEVFELAGSPSMSSGVNFISGLLGPWFTLPFELTNMEGRDEVGAPIGLGGRNALSSIMSEFLSGGGVTQLENGDRLISPLRRSFLEALNPAFTEISELTGATPNDPRRAARLGLNGEDDTLGDRLRGVALRLGRAGGIQLQTPQDTYGASYEASQLVDAIELKAEREGRLVDPERLREVARGLATP